MKIILQAAAIGASVALMSFTSGAQLRAQSGSLPTGWQSRDIGAVGQPGSASYAGGTFTVSGAGARIWDTSDAFHFAYRSFTGDVTIVAEVTSLLGADPLAKVGVMIRATTDSRSQHALMVLRQGDGLAFQRRRVAGSQSYHTYGGAARPPRWLRLQRVGNRFTGSASADGSTWTTVGSDLISMPATVLVGLAANSHDTTRLATGTFSGVSVIAPPATTLRALEVTPNKRFLRTRTTGSHFFYLADTPWGIFQRLNRSNAELYLQDTVNKGFTAIQAAALWRMSSSGNAHGDQALGKTGTKYDPAKIITTAGNDPNDPVAYDYWDHVDYIIDLAAQKGLYVALEPTWATTFQGHPVIAPAYRRRRISSPSRTRAYSGTSSAGATGTVRTSSGCSVAIGLRSATSATSGRYGEAWRRRSVVRSPASP
jgi:regulation of enolase protein 1 (concanavalin A-like superfamily)